MRPFLDHVFDCYGPNRIMFGSNWSICEVDGPRKMAWRHWQDAVGLYMQKRGLSEEDKEKVWYRTAAKIYRLEV